MKRESNSSLGHPYFRFNMKGKNKVNSGSCS